MNDWAIIFSTTEKYLFQALAMYEQLRIYGLEKSAWVVPLETLSSEHRKCLQTRFDSHVTATLQMPRNVKLSGNKIFLPTMVPEKKKYVLIDTDILILEREFIDTFLDCPDDRIVLVEDTFSWQDWLQLNPSSYHIEQLPHLLSKPYVQTGSIGISSQTHKKIFDPFVQELLDESRRHRGDSIVWNDWVRRFSQLFHLVPPHSCLVLRPDGLGPSSTLHIPDLSYENETLHHRHRPVMAVHFTSSKGIAKTRKDYKQLMTTLNKG